MNANQILFDTSGRLRSGWRFAFFLLVFVVSSTALGGIFLAVFQILSISTETHLGIVLAANGLLTLTLALLIGWICGRYFEGVPFRALGAWFTRRWLLNLALGVLFGVASLGLAVLLAIAFAGMGFEPSRAAMSSIVPSLLVSFAVFAIGGAAEEALFRGYILQTFARSGHVGLAIALTSVPFGLVHLANPNPGPISTVNTILAGVWFGVAYLKTRDLWFVAGMHVMWNWMQGSVFGIEVSGLTDLVASPLLREIDRGPAWLTGESYGLEGGIVTTVALVVSTVAIYFAPFLKADEEMVRLTSPKYTRR